jgi:thiol-disulfide isomerase/thioredoxin
MGRVSPPVDVRSPSDIPKAIERLKKGPITIVFVYADWCGHCQTFKPKFNEAVQTPRRDTEIISVNEKVLDSFNSNMMNKIPTATPLEPSGYPEVMIVNKKGENIGNVPPSASKEDLINVVTNGSQMANSKTGSNRTTNAKTNTEPVPTPVANSANMSTIPSKTLKNLESISNTTPMSGPVVPPSANEDLLETGEESTETAAQKGGSLFGSLSSAAYTLAPTGVLLAGLHALRRNKTRRARKISRRRRH